MNTAYIGLGSNLSEPKQQIELRMQSSLFNETDGKLDLNTLTVFKRAPQKTEDFDMNIKQLELKGLYLSQLLQQNCPLLKPHVHFYNDLLQVVF